MTHKKENLLKELRKIAKEGRKRLKKRGIIEKDIPGVVEKSR